MKYFVFIPQWQSQVVRVRGQEFEGHSCRIIPIMPPYNSVLPGLNFALYIITICTKQQLNFCYYKIALGARFVAGLVATA